MSKYSTKPMQGLLKNNETLIIDKDKFKINWNYRMFLVGITKYLKYVGFYKFRYKYNNKPIIKSQNNFCQK